MGKANFIGVNFVLDEFLNVPYSELPKTWTPNS